MIMEDINGHCFVDAPADGFKKCQNCGIMYYGKNIGVIWKTNKISQYVYYSFNLPSCESVIMEAALK